MWIETRVFSLNGLSSSVTPFVGVWIETSRSMYYCHLTWSHPSWVCGLKRNIHSMQLSYQMSHPSWVCGLKHVCAENQCHCLVTPFVGVWIETRPKQDRLSGCRVTPFVGVWIETPDDLLRHPEPRSHPSWVCGLKQVSEYHNL